ncbi:hypothetical protein [Alteromonas lipolytica]|uniref:Uncharacterized protein n=1 Tax=Alteromonas lipolytica TaxID=1856405 RepID=A0A1E8FCT7_9ALTE|nr:hypothetical protein [Alteromonas lipolytica]OFI33745.1 hypothetical protein BFC17_19405 [Alteromonas lipolytica]GGF68785.1 hypothetical protein GCM10011338_21240 [Alteromonas lipolytica]
MAPDYRTYSKEQLEEALDSIDKSRFPERVAQIEKALKQLSESAATDETDKEAYLLPEPETSEQQQRNVLALFGMISVGLVIGAMLAPAYFHSFLLADEWVTPFKWVAWTAVTIVFLVSMKYLGHPSELRKANARLLAKGKKPMRKDSKRRAAGIFIGALAIALLAGFAVFRGLPVALHLYVMDAKPSSMVITVAKLNRRYRKKHCNGKIYLKEYEQQLFDYVCQVVSRTSWEGLSPGQKMRLQGSQSALGFLVTDGYAIRQSNKK